MGGGGGGGEGEDVAHRPAALLITFEGERERGGGREGEEQTCPCTKCAHMHVVFLSIPLSCISVLL
jgi:hypothetical protein